MVAESTDESLVLHRTFPASPETVFRVWTSPEYMRQWLRHSKEVTHQFIEIDLRVGGRYRVAFQGPDGKVDVLGGEFLEIIPSRKLVYSWMWEEPNEHAGTETQVTVDFLGKDGGTELILTHERFTKAGMKESHLAGWTGTLALLDETMARMIQE